MSLIRIQQSTAGSGTTSAATSFGSLPSVTHLIVVLGYSHTDPSSASCSDNQGNTYHLARQSSGSFTGPAYVFYAYNIGAPSGTFTVTMSEAGSAEIHVVAIEFSNFSNPAVDPFFTSGIAGLDFPTSTPTTALAMTGDAVVVSVCATQLGATPTFDVSVPAWTSELSASHCAGASKITTALTTQSATWSSGNNMNSVIAAFVDPTTYTPPRFTQIVQSIAGQLTEVPVRATQMVQGLMYTDAPRPRITQVVQVLVVRPIVPPIPPIIPTPTNTSAWKLLRFDLKRRAEEEA